MEENANEVLAGKRQQIVEENLVRDAEDLHVGDIIYMELDRNDGLVLKDGYDTRLKYVVVAGSKTNHKEYGVVLINSDADYSNAEDWLAEQYLVRQQDYPGVLDYDSWIDCTDPKEISLRKIKSKKAEKKGRLNDNDLRKVMHTLKESDFVEPHFKKVYGINEFIM